MRTFLRDNGLSLALFSLFVLCEVGLSCAGWREYDADRRQHDLPDLSYAAYVTSSAFVEATTENWESEFLEMFAYVLLTALLYQRGSAESKPLDEKAGGPRTPASRQRDAPWPVRRGGWVLRLYENSLSLMLLALFLLAFICHALSGASRYSIDQVAHGGVPVSVAQYLGSSQFWFESMQNWQSEFFGIGTMVVLSIFLRQRGSPESKPVAASHGQTGG